MKGSVVVAGCLASIALVGAASGVARDRAARPLPSWERSVLGDACGSVVGFAFPVYRLPGLTDDDTKGLGVLARVRCTLASSRAFEDGRLVRVLGAAPSTRGRRQRPWILVELVRKPALRGWMPLHLRITVESMKIPWLRVPVARVREANLPAGMPDLHVAAFEPSAKPGDRCQVVGSPVRVRWIVSAGNAGPGAGPRIMRAQIGEQAITMPLTRRIRPAESVALGIADGEVDVVVDPGNEVVESDETNNLRRSPPTPPDLKCGP